MTPERAQYILARQSFGELRFAFARRPAGPIHADGITPAEHEAIAARWKKMPGWTCYADAVAAFAYPERWTATARKQVIEACREIGADATVDIDDFETMDGGRLMDELTYLADYQG
jgi:hypothetical protein